MPDNDQNQGNAGQGSAGGAGGNLDLGAANSGSQGGQGSQGSSSSNSGTSGGDGGGQQKTWIDELPEDVRGEASLKNIKDVATLAKSYVHAQRMVGSDKIAIPGKFATKDDWNAVYKKLGLPDSPDKYEIKAPEGSNAEFLRAFKETAHQNGILPQQASALMEWYQKSVQGAVDAQKKTSEESLAAGQQKLREEWGAGLDKKFAQASVAFEKFADDGFKNFLKETGLSKHPEVLKHFAKLGETLGEDVIKGEADRNMGKTPDEAQGEINEIMGNHEHPYWKEEHPNHSQAVKHVERLYQYVNHKAS